MSSFGPFSARRARSDLVDALPALCMVLGAVLGAGAGAFRELSGGAVTGGGLGIVIGLVLGLLLRVTCGGGRRGR